MNQKSRVYRPDIDGLRAIAVLLVVAYHFAPDSFPGGFIGVDIFFVISGYLITGILIKQFETRTFSLLDFYQRRIRRIFPALAVILAFCLVAGWLVMYSFEYEMLAKHIAASAGFVQNIVLWREAGYFDADAIQKPLLHLWSLAVEEQFYIAWPLVLWLIVRTQCSAMTSIAVIACLSFTLNLWEIHKQQDMAAFYLPLSRAWELMVGAWLAIGHRQKVSWLSRFSVAQSWLGIVFIAVGVVVIRPEGFPGLWGLIPVLGSALIINAGPVAFANRRLLSWRPAVWIGLISYPLYLWHWTLLSFVVITFGDSIESALLNKYKLIALALSVVFAWLTYRWLERPIRARGHGKMTVALAISVICLAIASVCIYVLRGVPDRPFTFVSANADELLSSIVRPNPAKECFDSTTGPTLPEQWSCSLGHEGADIWIAALGDSHARSLITALDHYGKAAKVRIEFGGMSGCPPLLEVYPERLTGPACERLVQKMAHKATDDGAAGTILIARWTYYVGGTTRPEEIQPIRTSYSSIFNPDKIEIYGLPALEAGLESTLAYYHSNDIPVLLVQDNPQQASTLPLGVGRFVDSLTDNTLNATAVSIAEHHRNQFEVNQALQAIAVKFPKANILNTDPALCETDRCPWVANGKFLYFDDDHLSVSGAMKVFPLLADHLDEILGAKFKPK